MKNHNENKPVTDDQEIDDRDFVFSDVGHWVSSVVRTYKPKKVRQDEAYDNAMKILKRRYK